jgi:NAD(P)-dependent dehydrogenase (short-subunit alcohol dehydrogenase family)
LHRKGRIDFEDLQSEKHFDRYQAYANSKLALILFTKKLSRDLVGTGITVNALHPGVVATRMNAQNIAHMNPVVRFVYEKTLLSSKQGAASSVYLATSAEVANVSGEYFDAKKIVPASPLADDHALADRLWDMSVTLSNL